MFKAPVELKNYNRRADRSVSLRVDTTFEMTPEDIAEIDSHLGDLGVLVLTDTPQGNSIDINMGKILEGIEVDKEIPQQKSPSRRFRDILWKLLEEQLGKTPTDTEFAVYYKTQYDKICSYYLDKFKN